jgi:hypothetical protein
MGAQGFNGRNLGKMKRFWLSIPDKSLVKIISEATPPNGVAVFGPQDLVALNSGGHPMVMFLFTYGGAIATNIVASWLWEILKKSGKKSGTINGKKVAFKENDIQVLVEIAIAHEHRTNSYRHKKKPLKKRKVHNKSIIR